MLRKLRRFGFRLLYNECAFTYDLVSRGVSQDRWRSWQRSVMPYLPLPEAGPILELAQGTGDLQLDIQSAGYRVVGLDRSRSMSRLAQRKLWRARLGADLIRGEADCLPIQSDSIAAIVCTFPTSFIIEQQTLMEMRRVLKRDAQAVIVFSALLTGGGLIAQFIRSLYRLTGQATSETAREELVSLFQAPGLTAEAYTLPADGSLVQIVLLTRTAPATKANHDNGLDLVRES